MAVKVKKLEWTQYPDGGLQAIGAKMERFRVHPNGRSWYRGQDYMGDGGKDAAQTWFDEAILSAIEEA